MRSDERNFSGGYRNYRDEEYGRDRDRGYNRDMRNWQLDRSNQYGDFFPHREIHGRYEDDRGYNRNSFEDRGDNFNRDQEHNRFDGRTRGQYHSTETTQPGRGYDTELEMNRHMPNVFDNPRDRAYMTRSVHRSSGPYEDFERDRERYNIRGDYNERYGYYDMLQNRNLDRGPSGSWGRRDEYRERENRFDRDDRGRY